MTPDMNPSRCLNLDGSYNTRDIGGYPTASGNLTRWNTFFRSDSMHRLTPQDRNNLLKRGIRTAIDLRTTSEIYDKPNVFANNTELSYRHINLIGDDYVPESALISTGLPATRISLSYIHWLDTRQSAINEILSALAEVDNRPAIYHCAGGKDRTGLITALLLANAGVSKEVIVTDYILTARFLISRMLQEQEFANLHPRTTTQNDIKTWQQYEAEFCPPAGMTKVLNHIDSHYNGVKSYLSFIGLSSEHIKTLETALVG